jgi:hypothetical protein
MRHVGLHDCQGIAFVAAIWSALVKITSVHAGSRNRSAYHDGLLWARCQRTNFRNLWFFTVFTGILVERCPDWFQIGQNPAISAP